MTYAVLRRLVDVTYAVVRRLEDATYAVFLRSEAAMAQVYWEGKYRPQGRADALARLWQKAVSDFGEAYGSILHLAAALADKADGKRADPRDYHVHLNTNKDLARIR